MKTLKYIVVCVLAAVLGSQKASADEGMWLIHTLNAAIEKKMQERGLELSVNTMQMLQAQLSQTPSFRWSSDVPEA